MKYRIYEEQTDVGSLYHAAIYTSGGVFISPRMYQSRGEAVQEAINAGGTEEIK